MPTYNEESYAAGRRFAEANERLHEAWPNRNEPGFEIQPPIDEYNAATVEVVDIDNDMDAEGQPGSAGASSPDARSS